MEHVDRHGGGYVAVLRPLTRQSARGCPSFVFGTLGHFSFFFFFLFFSFVLNTEATKSQRPRD